MASVKSLDISNGLDDSKFDILKSLLQYILTQVEEEDEYYVQLMCYAKKLNIFVDELDDDEYNKIYEDSIADLKNILSILERSEKNFNKRMIF